MIIESIDNIQDYLHQHEHKDMLRFITCGSVDDGKSTLIGRLLHDSKMIFEDQLAAITRDSVKHGTTGEVVDLALLVDGLQSEREQGITIDVAYRFFATDNRKYIIADTPGHEQYTRNMATGASTADVAILLIDARYGVQVQTRRHSFICSLLGIKHFVVAINKMDLVDYSQARFDEIKAEYEAFVAPLNVPDIHYVPMSALLGENVVNASTKMPWYDGQAMLALLDSLPLQRDTALDTLRLPVQYVNRPNLNFRGFCGTIAAGTVTPGMAIKALPSGKTSTVKSIVVWEGELAEAHVGQAITLTLNDEIDISRGDMIVAADPELWNLYNGRINKGESIRVFPLSNWTELDIWQYLYLEQIEIVPLYLSAPRPVVERDGMLIMVDDERLPLREGEVPMVKNVRFRTLGCYPLTGAVESDAATLPEIIQEMLVTRTSERSGRAIDHDESGSMEKKKREGYF